MGQLRIDERERGIEKKKKNILTDVNVTNKQSHRIIF